MIQKLTHEHITELLRVIDKELDAMPESVGTSTTYVEDGAKKVDWQTPTYTRNKMTESITSVTLGESTKRKKELLLEMKEFITTELAKISFKFGIESSE